MRKPVIIAMLVACSSDTKPPDLAAPGVAVTLKDGTTIVLPPDAKLSNEVTSPPDNLVAASQYRVPALDAFIGINLGKPTGEGCEAILETSRRQTEDARTNDSMKQMLRVQVVELRKLGQRQVLYTEVASRSADEAKQDKPFRGGAGYLLCTKTAFVNLTLIGNTDLTALQRDVLTKVATSVSP